MSSTSALWLLRFQLPPPKPTGRATCTAFGSSGVLTFPSQIFCTILYSTATLISLKPRVSSSCPGHYPGHLATASPASKCVFRLVEVPEVPSEPCLYIGSRSPFAIHRGRGAGWAPGSPSGAHLTPIHQGGGLYEQSIHEQASPVRLLSLVRDHLVDRK